MIDEFDTEEKAEKECEEWGWSYSENGIDYWMGIIEISEH